MPVDDQPLSPRDAVRAEIREFLSTRRARITPEKAGLPNYGGDRRRVAGLRREEVAVLAGVSPQYYVRLERGDATGISDGIIDGVAHALQLDPAERAHLMDLLRTAGTPRRARPRPAASPQPVRSSIQRLLDAMNDTPAVVMSGRLDIVAANPLGRALFSPVFGDQDGTPNTARYIFLNPQSMTYFPEWETVANDTVAILRAEAGRDPHSRELSDLVGQLSTRSDDFRVRWAAHDVRIHSNGIKKFHHPVVGELELPYESLPLAVGSSSNLVAYTAEPTSASQDALALLASWAISEHPEEPNPPKQRSASSSDIESDR